MGTTEIQARVDQLGDAWEQFKRINNERLAEHNKRGWKTIDSAPENCEPILLTNSNSLGYMFVGYFDYTNRKWRYWGREDEIYDREDLTHWMPLPLPPLDIEE